jgi:hypothetical protein
VCEADLLLVFVSSVQLTMNALTHFTQKFQQAFTASSCVAEGEERVQGSSCENTRLLPTEQKLRVKQMKLHLKTSYNALGMPYSCQQHQSKHEARAISEEHKLWIFVPLKGLLRFAISLLCVCGCGIPSPS